jgi:hypothetical protein
LGQNDAALKQSEAFLADVGRGMFVRPGIPETERDMTWSAHERVEIRPAVSTVTPSGSARAAR